MEWFKHKTGSRNDPDIAEAFDEFGDKAYSIFFMTLELYGREFNRLSDDGKLTLTKKTFARELRKSWATVEKLWRFYEKRQRFFLEIGEKTATIRIPKFINIASNWTARDKRKNDESPTEAPTEAPTAKEGEVEGEVDLKDFTSYEVPDDEKFRLPTVDELNNASVMKISKDLKIVCDELYKTKVFPKAHAFANAQIKKKKNRRAILHTLTKCLLKRDFEGNPWSYCEKIIQVENGNYNEADYQRTA